MFPLVNVSMSNLPVGDILSFFLSLPPCLSSEALFNDAKRMNNQALNFDKEGNINFNKRYKLETLNKKIRLNVNQKQFL